MGDLSFRRESFGSGDQSYIVKPGDITEVGCTLDLTLFPSTLLDDFAANHHNCVPGGLALAKYSADGTFGPYTPLGAATNEVQTLTISGSPTGGVYSLTFDGETTTDLAHNANAAAIEAALEALPNLAAADVAVTSTGPFTITFGGVYAQENVPQISTTSALTGGSSPLATITTATPGVPGLDTFAGILFDAIPYQVGATSGQLTASRIVLGAIYETKLPYAAAATNAPGKVDANAKTDLPTIAFITL